jgi:hypothetical protein
VPLRVLAEYWLAYYWPFVDLRMPIFQGPQALRAGGMASDMAFRPALMDLRRAWEALIGGTARLPVRRGPSGMGRRGAGARTFVGRSGGGASGVPHGSQEQPDGRRPAVPTGCVERHRPDLRPATR